MHPPHTTAYYRITVELGFAGCEEDKLLPDLERRVELKHLFDLAGVAWGA